MIIRNPVLLHSLLAYQILVILGRYIYYYVIAIPFRYLFGAKFVSIVTPNLLVLRFQELVYYPFSQKLYGDLSLKELLEDTYIEKAYLEEPVCDGEIYHNNLTYEQYNNELLPILMHDNPIVILKPLNLGVRSGYSNSVQRLEIYADGFPRSAIIKSKTNNIAFEILGLTIREVQIMNLLMKKDEKGETLSGLKMPYVFYSNYHPITHEQVILMEDLTLRKYECLNIHDNEYCSNIHVVKLILMELACMHAKWMNCNWLHVKHPYTLLSSLHTNLASQWCHKIWIQVRESLLDHPEAIEFGDYCIKSKAVPVLLEKGETYAKTLTHGDLNLTNIFWRKDDDSIVFCDWCNCRFGIWIVDVTYLLSFNFSTELTSKFEVELLQFYRLHLISNLKKYGKSVPNEIENFDELQRIYQEQMYYIFWAMVFVCYETSKKGEGNLNKEYCEVMKERICATLVRCNTLEHVKKLVKESNSFTVTT